MKIKNFLENFILIAIVLVLIQTFLSEVSLYSQWSISSRNFLIYCGLFFDFLFSIEFTVRSIVAGKSKKQLFRYWFFERGWVDFISSFPLLLLDSGPSVYLLLAGGIHESGSAMGVLNVLKVVKAVRVTRILRLVRIIKIFGKIHNAESKMAQHHTSTIATTAVFTIVCALVIFSVFTDSSGIEKIRNRKSEYENYLAGISSLNYSSMNEQIKTAKRFFKRDGRMIKLFYNDELVLLNVTDDRFKKYFDMEDYFRVKSGNFSGYISIVDIHRDIAVDHIKNFVIIVSVVLSFMLVYTRHFVQNISDLIHIMNKGFRKKNYNLQIKIKDEYSDQEIYRLARFYNDAYLPAKMKRMQAEKDKKSSSLSMKDLLSFNKK